MLLRVGKGLACLATLAVVTWLLYVVIVRDQDYVWGGLVAALIVAGLVEGVLGVRLTPYTLGRSLRRLR